MKTSNNYLRIAFGIALFSYLLPFVQASVQMLGSQTYSGFQLAFGGSDSIGGGTRPPDGEIGLPLLFLIVAFLFSLRKKPLGRWIGILPIMSVFFFSKLFGEDGNGFVGLQWRIGLFLCFWVSLAAAIIGFIGRNKREETA